MTIREYLKQYKLITDGSFGTYYAEKYQTQEMPELANVLHPERVLQIHEEYVKSGARLLRTNTFAANTVLMDCNFTEVEKNIKQAVSIVKQAAQLSEEKVFVAGDIGPIPNDGYVDTQMVEEQYYQIAKVFVNEGVDALTFETFADMTAIEKCIGRIREESDVFIMVQFSINQFGYSNAGLSARKLSKEASSNDAIDAVGFNCGIGPGHMEQIYRQVEKKYNKYYIALPNAGYPKRIRNQLQFANNPVYFAQKIQDLANTGMDILGGCCGTNPSYIEELVKTVDLQQKAERQECVSEEVENKVVVNKGFFCNEDGSVKQKKLIAVELAPPANENDEKLLEAAYMLQNSGVDVLTFPDSPSGRTRIDSVLMAEKVKRETGMTVMPHICCRDKNAIAMRSLFLGAHINHIDNMLIITGDPIPTMVRQTVKAVFNFDAVGLMKIARDMNEENFSDRPLTYGGAINQGRRNLEVEIGRVKKKMEAGAQFFMTQPVFSKEAADRLRMIKEQTGARILCGIMPLISRKNALFMKNEIAGIQVTDEIIERYPENGTKEEGEATGVAIAREMMKYTKDFVDGYYFSFPFNRVYLLKQILK